MARMAHSRHRGRNPGRGGFTLVELAVAMFVVTTGLLAVFALLRRGQDSGTEIEADLRGGLFAETAFATLRAASDHAAATGTWEEFWTEFSAGTTNLPLPGATSDDLAGGEAAGQSFADAPDGPILATDGLRAYSFTGWPAEDDAGVYCVSNTVWYDMSLGGDATNVSVTLHVWPERPASSSQTYFTVFGWQDGRRDLRLPLPDSEDGDETESEP